MKTLALLALTLVTQSAFAVANFSGTWAGAGLAQFSVGDIQQAPAGTLNLVIQQDETKLAIVQDNFNFGDGATMQLSMNPTFEIRNGTELWYNNGRKTSQVGTISDEGFTVSADVTGNGWIEGWNARLENGILKYNYSAGMGGFIESATLTKK
jgi:hypothetical protein